MQYRPIRNSAQLTPSAVHFQMRLPSADLVPYVSDFWQYDVRPQHPHVRIQVFPSGCVVLRFNITDNHAEPILYGPSLRANAKSIFTRGISAFGVALQLERAQSLIHCDISEILDQRIELDEVWSDRLTELCDRLGQSHDFDSRVAILSTFLRLRLRSHRSVPSPHADFQSAIGRLARGERTLEITREIGVSDRTLRRHFNQNVGLAPKQIERVIRVQATMRALAEHPKLRQSELALSAGFSDQSHFTREFKRMLGMNPGDFTRYLGAFHTPSLPIWEDLNKRMITWTTPGIRQEISEDS